MEETAPLSFLIIYSSIKYLSEMTSSYSSLI